MSDNILNLTGLDDLFNEDEVDKKKKDEVDKDVFPDDVQTEANAYKSELDSILKEVDQLSTKSESFTNTGDTEFKIHDPDLLNQTMEDKKSKVLDNLFDTMGVSEESNGGTNYVSSSFPDNVQTPSSYGNNTPSNAESSAFSKDIEEDEKMNMVTEITLLRDDLDQMGVKTDHINTVSYNSSYNEVRQVLTILRTMLKRHKYSTFAEEVITTGATFLEELFDGKKTYLGRFSPDLTGWHKEVRQKLYRSRDSTSQFINDTVASYDIHPLLRLAAELIPSAVLYSHSKKASSQSNVEKQTEKSKIAFDNLSKL